MIDLFAIFRKPEPAIDNTPMRSRNGQFAPSFKERRRRSRFTDVKAALAIYCAKTTPSQRKAETEAYFASIRPHHVNEQVGEGT
jgi:hypothetical protein